jgi:hypothetical protein
MHFIPLVLAVSAEASVCLFQDRMWKHHGWAKMIIMDRGMQFAVKLTRMLQTDGHMEQINQELKQYLCLYVNHMQMDWANWLPVAEFTYNNHEHSATGHSPFYLEYGHHPRVPMTLEKPQIDNPMAEEFVDSLSQA